MERSQIVNRREGRSRLILVGALILNLAFVLVANLMALQFAPIRSLSRSTGGWLSPTLVVNVAALIIIVGGWLLAFGRTSPQWIGVRRSDLRRGLAIFAITWGAIQVLAAVGRVASGQSLLTLSPELTTALPILFGQLLGNALYEETFYRGYLIPALASEMGGRERAAVILSATLFGLIHVVNYSIRGLPMGLIIPATLAGVLLGFIYLRTRNLWLCVGLHSLLNSPTAVWESPIPAVVVPSLALFVCLWIGSSAAPKR